MTAVLPPDTVRVQTSENVALGYTTAGLGSRLVAQAIDVTAALVLVFFALLAYGALVGATTSEQGAVWAAGGAIAFATFVFFGYFAIAEVVSGGRTPGKAALGLRVMRLDGRAADIAALLVRNIVRVIDMTGAGIVVAFFHPLSRRLGDLAAGTVVVRDRAPVTLAAATAPPPIVVRSADSGPAVDGIEHLGRAEHEALRAFLSRQGLTPALRSSLAADLAQRLMARMQLPPAAPERMWPPELLLERVYLQLDARLQ